MTPRALPQSRPSLGLGLVLVGLLGFAWGCNWPLMKLVLTEVDVWTFRALSCAVGGLAFLAIAGLAGARLRVPRAERRPLLVVALLNVTAFQLLSAAALEIFEAGPSVILAYTAPAWTALLGALFFGERLTRWRLLALALGLAGLVALLAPKVAAAGRVPEGAWIALLSAVVWAVAIQLQKRQPWTIPSMTAWQLVIGGAPIVLGALFLGDLGSALEVSGEVALAWAYVTAAGMIAGHYLWFRIVALYPATVSGVCSLTVPVVGVFAGAVLIGERVGPSELAALACVVPAVALVLFERR
jgi:drug/metabolite transporter (DMT)-like permease